MAIPTVPRLITNIQVVELVEGRSKEITQNDFRATRKFIQADAKPDSTPIELPQIGDSLDAFNLEVRCKTIKETTLAPTAAYAHNYLVYVCEYDGRPMDNTSWNINHNIDVNDYPQGISISGDFESYSNDDLGDDVSNRWNWPDGSMANGLMINKVQVLSDLTYVRYIEMDKLPEWIDHEGPYINTINSKIFQGIPIGHCLYAGATANPVLHNNKKRWELTLKFSVKFVPLTYNEQGVPDSFGGWNYAYNAKKNTYEIPHFAANVNDTLFRATDYESVLFDSFKPTVHFLTL